MAEAAALLIGGGSSRKNDAVEKTKHNHKLAVTKRN
jgi:hypothetical protein